MEILERINQLIEKAYTHEQEKLFANEIIQEAQKFKLGNDICHFLHL